MSRQNGTQAILCWLIASAVFLLAACGSSEDSRSAAAQDVSGSTKIGFVIGEKGPVADAKVVIKAANGQEVGQVTTNSQGEYRLSTNQQGPFMGEATLPSGKVWFGIGQNANMNITHLGDFLIRLWYQAKSLNVATAFASLSSGASLPSESGLNLAVNQMISVPAYALGKDSVNLFGSEMTPTLAKILQSTLLEGNDQIRIQLPEVRFNGVYEVKASLAKNGEVFYSGSEETESVNVPLTKGPISATVGSSSVSGAAKLKASSANDRPNEHWMKDNWEAIKDKRIDQLVIPGTHDSGTYQLRWGTGADTAKTQIDSIGDQLKDGIRYFDLRVREASHRGCADPSVWWIYHGWDSYRLVTAMDEIQKFLSKAGNESEVIILDFQNTKIVYNDDRARDVLIKSIQDYLGTYLAKNEGEWNWQKAKMTELVGKNKRVIVLLENSLYVKISDSKYTPGCGVTGIDHRNFSNRKMDMVSAYDEDYAKSAHQIKYLIGSEFDQAYMKSAAWSEQYKNYEERYEIYVRQVKKGGMDKELYNLTFPDSALLADVPDSPYGFEQMMNERVQKYTEYPKLGKLRVLQLVARPSNAWMAAAAAAPIGGDDLLSYATREINVPLNYPSSTCQEGWLGKRLRMGIEGGAAQWNPPNIIIADNYRANEWVVPDYQGGKWVIGRPYTNKNKSKSYVDMAIELNNIKPSSHLSGVPFQDGQCLP
ncbi:MAG: hypothetical protein RL651_981 [Pseudomonadota bacterium]|jgi:hypothetical protein